MANVVTRTGKSVFPGRLKGEGSEPKVVAWGLDPAELSAAATDVGLFNEPAGDARATGTSEFKTTSFTNDTYTVVGTQTATEERLIREAGLFDSTTKPFKTTVAAGSKVIGSSSETELKTAATYTPANGTYIQVRGEVMKVEAGSGSTTLTVKRAENGSAASSGIATADAVTQGNIPGPYSTGTTAPSTGATLIAHADIGLNTLKSSDAITWTWTLQFT